MGVAFVMKCAMNDCQRHKGDIVYIYVLAIHFYTQGHRSKTESGKEKFYGQLLASFVNRIDNNSVLKAC